MIIVAYGPAINDALSNPRTSLQDLKTLRDHAYAVLQTQGDLKAAVKKLDQEIKRRSK